MKKKILIFLLALVVIVGGLLAYAAVNLNSLISRFKPELERTASKALNMPVELGLLEASVFPETKIIVKQLKLGGRAQSDAFKLKELSLKVKLSSLIFSKKLEITTLSIKEPEITVNKTEAGVEISGVPRGQKAGAKDSAQAEPAEKGAPQAASPIEIGLNSLEVDNARLVLSNFMPGKPPIIIHDIDVKSEISLKGSVIEVKDLSLDAIAGKDFDVKFKSSAIKMDNESGLAEIPAAELYLDKSRIDLSAAYNLKEKGGKANISSSGIDIASLLQALPEHLPPAVSEFNPTGSVAPKIALSMKGEDYNFNGDILLKEISAQVKQFKVSSLNGTVNTAGGLKKQTLKSNDLALSLNESPINIVFETALELPAVNLEKLVLNAFSGTVTNNGKLILGTPPTFSLSSRVSGLDINSLMKAVSPGSDLLVGKIESAEADLQGSLDGAFMQNLAGQIKYVLVDGALKGFNLGGMVLKAVNNVAIFSGSLYEKVQSRRELFDVADTVVKRSSADLKISRGSIYTDNLILTSTAYDLYAQGRIGLDVSVDLKANIHFTEEISALLAQSVKELKKVLDEKGRLSLPLALSGKPPALIVVPDFTKVLEMAAKAAIREKAGDLIGDAIKRKTGIETEGIDKLLGF